MDKHTEELKRAIEREPFKKALEFLRTGKSPGVERVKNKLRTTGERAVKAERRADVIEKVAGDTGFLKKVHMDQKKRKRKAAKKARRDTKDSGLWDRYDTFRAMLARIKRGEKQLAAATDLIEKSDGVIDQKPETLVRYFRAWKKKRKTD
ncbi:MAG: hypothetical protein EOM10_09250 [Opitutae bacterium]|nr:hypothetical protein [Opitutae bacterium]